MEAGVVFLRHLHKNNNFLVSPCLRRIFLCQRKAEEDGYELYGLTFDPPLGTKDENFEMFWPGRQFEFFKKEDYSGIEVGRFIGLKNSEELLKKFVTDRRNENHRGSFLCRNSWCLEINQITCKMARSL